MKKLIIAFVVGACVALTGVLAFMHRALIVAAIKGEKLPEAPEGCPAFKG